MNVLIAMPTTDQRPPVKKNSTNIGHITAVETTPFSAAISIGINNSVDIPHDSSPPKRIAPPPYKKHNKMRLNK